MLPAGKLTTFGGSFIVDDFARFLKILALIGSVATLVLSTEFLSDPSRRIFEYSILVLLSTLGMMVLISAGDLIALYLGLELMSLALYVVAASNRDNVKSTEAGLKYFVLGALSSGMLLYGASLVYGFTGTVSFAGIAAAAKTGSIGIVFGLVFLLAGLCFKVSAVPFHMWTPDVYEGAPTPVTAFFASAPKVAAMAVFVRVAMTAFPGIAVEWQQIVVFVSIASMALGAFAAIGQKNIKRLMAYSSIGHMGYALVGLAAGTPEGAQGVLVYLAIYVAMTLGSFAIILAMKRNGQAIEQISDFAGLSRTNPLLAFFFAMFLFSLAGIPPLAGFFAKCYVFVAAIKAGLFTLAVIGVLTSVVGAFYYLTIVKVMYFDEPLAKLDPVRVECARCWRSPASSTSCSSSIRGRWSVCDHGGEVADSRCPSRSVRAPHPPVTGSKPTTRSVRPMWKRWRVRATVTAGRSGSSPRSRRRGGDGVSGPGSRRAAISPAACSRSFRITPATAATLGFAAGLATEAALRKVSVEAALRQDRSLSNTISNGRMTCSPEAGSWSEYRWMPKRSDDRLAVVVGIGTNVVAAPEGTPTPATSLAALGVQVGAEELFSVLSDSWVEFRGIWDNGRGFGQDPKALARPRGGPRAGGRDQVGGLHASRARSTPSTSKAA